MPNAIKYPPSSFSCFWRGPAPPPQTPSRAHMPTSTSAPPTGPPPLLMIRNPYDFYFFCLCWRLEESAIVLSMLGRPSILFATLT